jgi:ribonuclease HI
VKIYFDGGCRPNPGTIEVAVVAGGRLYHRADLGHGDSNDAEWLALIEALVVARDLGIADVTLLGDSATVVAQASGASRRLAPRFSQYHARFGVLVAGLDRVRIRRVPRTQNLAGIALARLHGRR